MIRILQVVNAPDRGGSETMAMNLFRNINRDEILFDFTNHSGRKAAYEDEIISLGGKVHYLPKFKGYNYWGYVKAWRRLLADHPEYQIIHIHNYNIAGIVAKVARDMGVNTRITHSHSTRLNMSWPKRMVFKMLHGSMVRNSTHLFACGGNAGHFLFGNRNFTVVPNALDTSKFRFNDPTRNMLRAKLGISDDVRLYGHVGSFRRPKNHSFLIDIFAEIHRQEPSAKLVLVGSGELMQPTKAKVETLGLSDSVIFLGQQPNVNEWLNAFDVFLMPSLWEGLPVSVVEAQCDGLPCVISDVIDHDVNLTGNVQFLPLTYSPHQWADAIVSVKSANRTAMGDIVERSPYNIDIATANITKFYKDNIR